MISAPMTGTTITQAPSVWAAGECGSVDKAWKKNRLVNTVIAFSKSQAVPVLSAPMTAAMAPIGSRRASPLKSRRGS
jgi:hypothetical protein